MLNYVGFRKPQDKIEWTILIGTGFILLAIICSLLFVKKPVSYPPQTLPALYITGFLKDIGFGIIASAILVGGLIRLRKGEKKARGYMGTIGGILLFLFMIGKPAITSTMLSNIQSDTFKVGNRFEKLSEKLNRNDFSSAGKARFRKSIAKKKYFQDGSLAEYVAENGTTMKYSPTPEDIQDREMGFTMARMIMILRAEMLFWAIVFVAVLTGYINYVKRKRQD
jgi:hypothetical protein